MFAFNQLNSILGIQAVISLSSGQCPLIDSPVNVCWLHVNELISLDIFRSANQKPPRSQFSAEIRPVTFNPVFYANTFLLEKVNSCLNDFTWPPHSLMHAACTYVRGCGSVYLQTTDLLFLPISSEKNHSPLFFFQNILYTLSVFPSKGENILSIKNQQGFTDRQRGAVAVAFLTTLL